MTTKLIGTKISEVLKEKKIVVKTLLKMMRTQFPHERGLTENGFKYSLENDTVKSGLLVKLADSLDMPLIDLLPDEFILSASQLRNRIEEIEKLTARVRELENDKAQCLKIISFLEEKVKQLESGSPG